MDRPDQEVEIDDRPRAAVTIEERQAQPLARREPDVDDRDVRRPQLVHDADDTNERKQSMEIVIVRHSPDIGELAGALSLAQGQFESVEKSLQAKIKMREEKGGGEYRYSYERLADVLDVIRKPMSDNGLAYMQFPFTGLRTFTVRTMLLHKSGQWIYNDLRANLISLAPQDVGSACSYIRRYALKAILSLSATDAEENDGAEFVRDQRRADPPRPAAQRSQERQATPEPAKTSDAWMKGAVHEVIEKGDDAVVVRLVTGYQAATKDPELLAGARKLKKGDVVELVATPPTRPKTYPILKEIIPLQS